MNAPPELVHAEFAICVGRMLRDVMKKSNDHRTVAKYVNTIVNIFERCLSRESATGDARIAECEEMSGAAGGTGEGDDSGNEADDEGMDSVGPSEVSVARLPTSNRKRKREEGEDDERISKKARSYCVIL
jgi:hypothetical protein